MTVLSRRLRLYSTRKKNQLKQIIKGAIIVASFILIILIGQQIFLKIRNQQKQITTPQPGDVLTLISQLALQKSLAIDSISEEPDMIILLLEDKTQVFLDKKKLIENQLDALQLIVNQDKINGRKAKKIDLRFNNPVVAY